MAAFKWTDELVDELTMYVHSTKNKFSALAGETRLASRAEGFIPLSINVCLVAYFVFSSSG